MHEYSPQQRNAEAIDAAWTAYRRDVKSREGKVVFASMLGEYPGHALPEMRDDIVRLLQDKDVAPDPLSATGWYLLSREAGWNAAASESECGSLAQFLGSNPLALALLHESPVHHCEAERVLTRLRRWLLLSGGESQHKQLLDALATQASLNGGAWPFDQAEREMLNRAPPNLVAGYSPARTHPSASDTEFADPMTLSVAQRYESWPFPPWRRIMSGWKTWRLSDEIRILDPTGPQLPVHAKILIAGCGTGSEAAQVALKYPDAAITAIDISQTSLNYARERWTALKLRDVRFVRLDLHKVSELNERFDAIFSSGVLHHLPNPEAGWAALAAVLRAGGVMRIMLYSRAARSWIHHAKTLIHDLAAGPIDDDVLRAVRKRFLDMADHHPLAREVVNEIAFSTLGGTQDMLLHPQEDAFDIPRIGRVLERLRLRLLTFVLPNPDAEARYATMFPRDPLHLNLQSLASFERRAPLVFIGQYDFWCRSEAFWRVASFG